MILCIMNDVHTTKKLLSFQQWNSILQCGLNLQPPYWLLQILSTDNLHQSSKAWFSLLTWISQKLSSSRTRIIQDEYFVHALWLWQWPGAQVSKQFWQASGLMNRKWCFGNISENSIIVCTACALEVTFNRLCERGRMDDDGDFYRTPCQTEGPLATLIYHSWWEQTGTSLFGGRNGKSYKFKTTTVVAVYQSHLSWNCFKVWQTMGKKRGKIIAKRPSLTH